MSGLFLRHIRKFDKLASVRQRDPRVSHAFIMFALLRVICFLCKRRALNGRFPGGFAFGSHSVVGPRLDRYPLFQTGGPARFDRCERNGQPGSARIELNAPGGFHSISAVSNASWLKWRVLRSPRLAAMMICFARISCAAEA